MAELAEAETCGLVAASTFSGCGGSSLGYKFAGFELRWASEFVPAAQDTYRANHPKTVLDVRDVRDVRPEEILDACGVRAGELDLFDGSPPCASFSTAGAREDGWGKVKKYSDLKQRTDDLFFEYIRLLKGVQPRAFVAENVAGLAIGTATGVLVEVLREMRAAGYRVKAKVLDAQWLGVPQQRRRTIFVGFREDLGIDPVHPDPLPYRYTVADACPWLAAPGLVPPPGFEPEPESTAVGYAIDPELRKMGPGEKSSRYLSLIRAAPDLPSPTLTAQAGRSGPASVCPPYGIRKYSVIEAKRISGFPDDFVLTGDFAQKLERLGRAVPPLMMARIAARVRDELLRLDGRPPFRGLVA
jgi:DNA (cytosine-5)-methyltransferase 1